MSTIECFQGRVIQMLDAIECFQGRVIPMLDFLSLQWSVRDDWEDLEATLVGQNPVHPYTLLCNCL